MAWMPSSSSRLRARGRCSAAVRPGEADHHVEGGGLAGPVGAQESDHLALADLEVHLPDHHSAAVRFGESSGPEDVRARGLRAWWLQRFGGSFCGRSCLRGPPFGGAGFGGSRLKTASVRTSSWPSIRILSSPTWKVKTRPSTLRSGSWSWTLSPTSTNVSSRGV